MLREPKMKRCKWAGTDPAMIAYHDREWGRPVHDDRTLFEFLILEGAQAGLSWATVLRKRENYRRALAGFDWRKVARFDARKVSALLRDEGLIRNRLKIQSVVTNARAFEEVRREFGSFDAYVWGFVGGRARRRPRGEAIRASSPESDALSRDLKTRGFKFVGTTIMYAFMQACGLVDDHDVGCAARS